MDIYRFFGKLFTLSMIFWISLLSWAANAQENIELNEVPIKSNFDFNFWEQHDKGFFFGVQVGAGYLSLHSSLPKSISIAKPLKEKEGKKMDEKLESEEIDQIAGVSLFIFIDIGGIVAKNLALKATAFGLYGGASFGLGAGPSVRYWFGDSGWFVDAVVGPMTFQADQLQTTVFKNLVMSGQLNLGLSTWLTNYWHGSIVVTGGAAGGSLVSNWKGLAWWVGGGVVIGLN